MLMILLDLTHLTNVTDYHDSRTKIHRLVWGGGHHGPFGKENVQ